MLNRINQFFLLSITLIITACTTDTVFHSYLHIPEEGWDKSDTLLFTVPLDSAVAYHISLELRNTDNYPYTNLFLLISNNISDSTHYHTDTLECTVANKDGKWIGKGWSNLYQSKHPYISFSANQTRNFTLRVIQNMRDIHLKGLSDVGIHIEKK